MSYPTGWGEENPGASSPPSLQVIEKQPLMACPSCAHYVIVDLHHAHVMRALRMALGTFPLVMLLAIANGTLAALAAAAIVVGFFVYRSYVLSTFDKYRCTACGFQFSYAVSPEGEPAAAMPLGEAPEESLGSYLEPWWKER